MIPESELILDGRGAIYHLGLRPEELAETVLVVGDPERVPKVSRHFDSIEFRGQHREFHTHTGRLGAHRLTVMSTGIGPDNIDIALNELDALANIDFASRTPHPTHRSLNIIRLGTCGALQADIPVDALVASTHGLGFDNVLNYYEYDRSQDDGDLGLAFAAHTGMSADITMPYAFEGSAVLIGRLDPTFIRGITLTAPGFYGPQGRELRLRSRTRTLMERIPGFRFGSHRVTNFEMETSAIYGLGKLLGHQCLSINVVVANRMAQRYSADGQAAVENMIERSLQALINH